MFDFTGIRMEELIIHKVGNKLKEEGFVVSKDICDLTDGNVEELLLKYFLSSFKEKVVYKFFHETDIHLNELYMYVSQIFINRETFYEQSIAVLKHLYEKAVHPQIKGGEFYMTYFSGCKVNDQEVDAIGIFKTERKENYLKVGSRQHGISVDADTGINVRKLDKGCIIFNIDSVDGYRVAYIDNVNKGNNEAAYWKEDFIRLADVEDEYYQTQNVLAMCQDFAETIYGPVCQADRKDQVLLMNEAISYFTKNNEFQMDDFAAAVMKKPELIEQFKEHAEFYEQNQAIKTAESFAISEQAVKKAKRKCKNLITLDTAIEIRLKTVTEEGGESQFIERGFDAAKGMHFYKVYFNAEE